MAINLDEEAGVGKSESGVGTGAPSRAPSASSAATQQAVLEVQKILTGIANLPVSRKPGAEMIPDGGWGPQSNASMLALLKRMADPASGEENNARAAAISQAKLVSTNHGETLANIQQIADVLSGRAGTTQTVGQGVKQPQKPQIYFVKVKKDDGQEVDFPVHADVWASPESLEGALEYTGLLSEQSSGEQRTQELHQAIAKVDSAIVALDPQHPESFQRARSTLMNYYNTLKQKYTQQGAKQTAAQYIRDNFSDLLAGLPSQVEKSLVNQIVANLQGERIVDNNGFIRDQSLMRGSRELIRERLQEWIAQRSGQRGYVR